jgi:N-acetylglucosaminyldiphosphoundecaprenol N-acetyl-beta-D-mannosaminyltransferase
LASLKSHTVLGVGVSALDYTEACRAVLEAAKARRALTVTALAVHGVMTGALDPEHRRRLNGLDLVLPDGQPVRWALNLLFRTGLADRVYGPNLMLRVCKLAEEEGLSVGFYGNRADVLEDLRRNLAAQFPALTVAAMMPSRFGRVSPAEQTELARQIEASGADIVFVGLGCPRQEVWLYENRGKLAVPTIAVGAAFDFHAKRLAQAPRWMQDAGLEWLFRLCREPKRLWRRYILLNPLFVSLLALQAIGLKRLSTGALGDTVPFEGYA